MALNPENIKFYQCETWTEGTTHGGGISATEIPDATLENVFDNIEPEEHESGDTEYRKIYCKNENTDLWPEVLVWISQFTPWTYDEISICVDQATWTDVQTDAEGYTFYQPDSKTHTNAKHPNVYDTSGVLQNSAGMIQQDQCFPIWIKRVVEPTTEGYTNNSAKITCGSE